MTDQDVVNSVMANKIQVFATNALREVPVAVSLVLGDFEGQMVVGDDDLLLGMSSSFELVLKLVPFVGV
jgi:hypothetical protein